VIICKKAGASAPSFKLKGGCYSCYNEKAWVNGKLIKKWIDLVFPPSVNGYWKNINLGLLQSTHCYKCKAIYESKRNTKYSDSQRIKTVCASQ
jgi:hypothetical protein